MRREHCAICGTTLWIKDTGWEDLEKGYINFTGEHEGGCEEVGCVAASDLLGDIIDGGFWEFDDKSPKYFRQCARLTVGIILGAIKENGKETEISNWTCLRDNELLTQHV